MSAAIDLVPLTSSQRRDCTDITFTVSPGSALLLKSEFAALSVACYDLYDHVKLTSPAFPSAGPSTFIEALRLRANALGMWITYADGCWPKTNAKASAG